MTFTIGKRQALITIAVLVLGLILGACGAQSSSFERRNSALGGGAAQKNNFLEAQQINQAEITKDQPHFVYWYWDTSAGIVSWTCQATPFSWTESLEPNGGTPAGSGASYWRYDIGEMYDVYTSELPGKDGTFGDPNPTGMSCMTIQGKLVHHTGQGDTFMSPDPIIWPENEVRTDLANDAIRLQAEQIIQGGQCVNPQALGEGQIVIIPCPEGYSPLQPVPAGDQTNAAETPQTLPTAPGVQ